MSTALAAALSLVLALSGAFVAPGTDARAAEPTSGVSRWSVEIAARPGTTTHEISTRTFTLAAVTWSRSSPRPARIELRTREGRGWGEWYELAVDSSPAPDGRFATEPFVADGASQVQARITAPRAPAGLRLDLVHVADDGTPGTAGLDLAPQGSSASGDELRPGIVTRRGWGADERRTKDVSSSTWLKAMYVHHTAGPNSYSRARAKAVVRGIWAFHTQGRGWPDIGYQFLVDRFGTIYEGRRGSIDGLPVGAQAGGYNASTIGVAVMGDHTSTEPSQRVVDAVVDVLAWQAHRYGVDPRGKVRLRTARSSGSVTRWAYGRLTPRLPVIRGHRDTNHTACPGARLYAKLPAIRRAVEAKVERAARRLGATPPQLRAPRPSDADVDRLALSAKVKVSWRELPGAVRYEVVKRSARHGRSPAQTKYAWKVEKTTARTHAKVRVPRGEAWVIGVRGLDALGRPGKVRELGTTTRPVATRNLELDGRWRTEQDRASFGRAVHVSQGPGARLRVDGARRARAVWIVAPTGPGQGRVRVLVDGERVATVSLARAEPDPRGRIRVSLRKPRSGRVVIRAVGKVPVRISAVALERGRF